MLTVIGVPAFADNYIWLAHKKDNPHVIIVDPGDADPVLEALRFHNLIPEALLITHHHGDHTGGIADLRTRFDIPVYGPGNENIRGISDIVHENDRICLPHSGLEFRVLEVPGHTRGHLAYFGHASLFCGDTLFTGGCGLLFEGTPEQMFDSLTRIARLPASTRVYCAHEYTEANLKFARVVEPDNAELAKRLEHVKAKRLQLEPTVPSVLKEELLTNPFLRCTKDTVIHAAERFAGKPLRSGSEVFAMVRHWKNTLD